jgi:hypothetical protein
LDKLIRHIVANSQDGEEMVMNEKIRPQCAVCSVKVRALPVAKCRELDFCSNRNYRETIEKTVKEYNKPKNRDFAEMVSTQETECYANRHVKSALETRPAYHQRDENIRGHVFCSFFVPGIEERPGGEG